MCYDVGPERTSAGGERRLRGEGWSGLCAAWISSRKRSPEIRGKARGSYSPGRGAPPAMLALLSGSSSCRSARTQARGLEKGGCRRRRTRSRVLPGSRRQEPGVSILVGDCTELGRSGPVNALRWSNTRARCGGGGEERKKRDWSGASRERDETTFRSWRRNPRGAHLPWGGDGSWRQRASRASRVSSVFAPDAQAWPRKVRFSWDNLGIAFPGGPIRNALGGTSTVDNGQVLPQARTLLEAARIDCRDTRLFAGDMSVRQAS